MPWLILIAEEEWGGPRRGRARFGGRGDRGRGADGGGGGMGVDPRGSEWGWCGLEMQMRNPALWSFSFSVEVWVGREENVECRESMLER